MHSNACTCRIHMTEVARSCFTTRGMTHMHAAARGITLPACLPACNHRWWVQAAALMLASVTGSLLRTWQIMRLHHCDFEAIARQQCSTTQACRQSSTSGKAQQRCHVHSASTVYVAVCCHTVNMSCQDVVCCTNPWHQSMAPSNATG
jgi:hypothetical protein